MWKDVLMWFSHSLCNLYNWRYKHLGNLPHVQQLPEFQVPNPGLTFDFQLINVEDFNGVGESEPNPYFYQVSGSTHTHSAVFVSVSISHVLSFTTTKNINEWRPWNKSYCIVKKKRELTNKPLKLNRRNPFDCNYTYKHNVGTMCGSFQAQVIHFFTQIHSCTLNSTRAESHIPPQPPFPLNWLLHSTSFIFKC